MEIHRTQEERFESLPGLPWAPRYRQWGDLRLAHLDVGEGPPVVMLHGEPTWSYLYRKMITPLTEAGYRCVCPDLPGFGRSDKPVADDWYSYDNHTAAFASLLDDLELDDVTLVVHDWGGPIGLRVATLERPERISRLVAMDTGVFTGYQKMSDGWLRFRNFVARNPDVPIARLVAGACYTEPPPEVIAAYEAPFEDERSKAGPRTFPPMIPLTPEAPGAAEGQAVAHALAEDTRPALVLWADSDPALPLEPDGRLCQQLFPTAGDLRVVERASHFLQEDQGEYIGGLIGDWLESS